MIGQFTYLDSAKAAHTAALDFTLLWVSDDPRLKRQLNRLFPSLLTDSSPEGGSPGIRLLTRAAAFYGVKPQIFSESSAPPGAIF